MLGAIGLVLAVCFLCMLLFLLMNGHYALAIALGIGAVL